MEIRSGVSAHRRRDSPHGDVMGKTSGKHGGLLLRSYTRVAVPKGPVLLHSAIIGGDYRHLLGILMPSMA